MQLKLAFSPCPNDTFMFAAMVHGLTDTEGLVFDYVMEDVETLNHLAMEGAMDMIKVSYHAYLFLTSRYRLLNSGSALGFGNGPLLITHKNHDVEKLKDFIVALPGEFTTAHLLFRLAFPLIHKKVFMRFSDIENAILEGKVDAGVIIHENRFTFEQKELIKLLDLGEFWESTTHAPIPLGGIVIRKGLGSDITEKLERVMHRSVVFARSHPEEVMPFVRCHAQEMDEEVMKKHIQLYVNDFSVSLGTTGKKAVELLFRIAKEKGLIDY